MARFVIGDVSEILVDRGWPEPILPERAGRTRAVVITQPGAEPIAHRVAGRLGVPASVHTLPDGEAAKSLGTVEALYGILDDAGLGRFDSVVGVGGGTVTDVAGFVGSTWLRGIETVFVPTTLLGAVDAAIGGKTGVNFQGKNLVGSFWQPARVVVNVAVLEGLPAPLIVEGLAESFKAGMIADAELVEHLRGGPGAIDIEFTARHAIAVKVAVVGADEREHGRRAILNYGHTIGHGIEAAAGIPHGHAVSIGMVAAGVVSEQLLGFAGAGRQRADLEGLGLPVTAPDGIDRQAVLSYVARDKKRSADATRMVLLRSVGDPALVPVTDADIAAGLAAVGVV